MSEGTWLHRLSLRAFRRGGRASVQVGLHRTGTHLVAARVRRDPDAGDSVEQLESADFGIQREEQAIAQLIATGILRNAQVLLVLGADHYNTYPLPAPPVPPAEVGEALRWKLRELLTYSPEDAVIDFVHLARAPDSSAVETLLAVAAPRRSVAQAMAPFLGAGVDLHAVDIAEMAQRNVLTRLPGADAGSALLGIEDSSALLTVVHRGAMCFARRIQIPRTLNNEEDDPEHVAARIATQVQRSLEVVERQSGLAPIRTVWIGPHPDCALIARCTAEHTALDCLQLDLAAELRFAATVREIAPRLAPGALIAIGAALRDEDAVPANRPAAQSPALSWLSKLKAA
jgi:MSHA biogenesis protein MshI